MVCFLKSFPEYGILAVIFFPARTLNVEWIRSLVSYFFKLESIPLILRYCIYESMYLDKLRCGWAEGRQFGPSIR